MPRWFLMCSNHWSKSLTCWWEWSMESRRSYLFSCRSRRSLPKMNFMCQYKSNVCIYWLMFPCVCPILRTQLANSAITLVYERSYLWVVPSYLARVISSWTGGGVSSQKCIFSSSTLWWVHVFLWLDYYWWYNILCKPRLANISWRLHKDGKNS